jgi:hypothetical protein
VITGPDRLHVSEPVNSLDPLVSAAELVSSALVVGMFDADPLSGGLPDAAAPVCRRA